MKDGGYSPTRDALDRLYTYDALNRLLSATGRETAYVTTPGSTERLWDASPWDGDVTKAQGYKEEYQYDAVGFVTELKRTSYPSSGAQVHTRTYSGFVTAGVQQNNRLASASYPDPSPMPGGPISVSYSYDDGGNCVSEGVERKYEWDHAGRLRSFRNQATDATEPTQYVQYLYDASGQRVKKLNRKQLGSDWDVVVYIDGVLEQRTQQRGATTKQGAVLHVLDGGKRLGMRRTGETFDAKPEHLLLLSDHLGSGSVELDWSLGDFLDREEFRPYGETSFGSYAHKRYRFTGKERDEESGLNYHGARYYAPGLARWMSPDPKGLVDGVNLYGYARGNPVGLSDPTGTESQPDHKAQRPEGGVIHSEKATGVLDRVWNWLTTPISANIQQQNENLRLDQTLLRERAVKSGSFLDWLAASVGNEEYGPAPNTPLEIVTLGVLASVSNIGNRSRSTNQQQNTKKEQSQTKDSSSASNSAINSSSYSQTSIIGRFSIAPLKSTRVREAFYEVSARMIKQGGSQAEQKALWEAHMPLIKTLKRDWHAMPCETSDGSHMWQGIKGLTLVIDKSGAQFYGNFEMNQNIYTYHPRSTRLMDGIYTPDYKQLVPLKDHILEHAPHFLAPEAVDK